MILGLRWLGLLSLLAVQTLVPPLALAQPSLPPGTRSRTDANQDPLVVHERGGNMFVAATERRGLGFVRTWRPAWVYDVAGAATQISVSGEGVEASFVSEGCVSAVEKPDVAVGLAESCATGKNLVRFTVAAGASPGYRNLVRIGAPARTGATERRREVPQADAPRVYVAHAGRVEWVGLSTRFPPGYHSRLRTRRFDTVKATDVDVARVRSGRVPLFLGANPEAGIDAPELILTFKGSGLYGGDPQGWKLVSPEGCLLESAISSTAGDGGFTSPELAFVSFRVKLRYPFGSLAASNGFVEWSGGEEAYEGSDGEATASGSVPSSPCGLVLYDAMLDRARSLARVYGGESAKDVADFNLLDEAGATRIQVGPRHFAIANIGESYAAGEGSGGHADAPVTDPGDRWANCECHRSKLNKTRVAARRLASLPGVWVQYRDLACSGAGINTGLLGPYVGSIQLGRKPGAEVCSAGLDEVPQVPQIDALASWLEQARIPRLDVLAVSVGGNDVGFPKVVALCTLSEVVADVLAAIHLDDDHCWKTELPLEGKKLEQIVETGAASAEGLTDVIGLDNLPAAYDLLDQRIRTLNPTYVMFSTYPDPTMDPRGDRYCSPVEGSYEVGGPDDPVNPATGTDDPTKRVSFGPITWGPVTMGGLDAAEAEWIQKNVVDELNAAIEDASREHGWEPLSGMVEYSRDHGFCAEDRYINTYRDSRDRFQADLNGTAHPNEKAHRIYSEILVSRLIDHWDLHHAPQVFPVSESYCMKAMMGNGSKVRICNVSETVDGGFVRVAAAPDGKLIHRNLGPVEPRLIVSASRAQVSAALEVQFGSGPTREAEVTRVAGLEDRIEFRGKIDVSNCNGPGNATTQQVKYRWNVRQTGAAYEHEISAPGSGEWHEFTCSELAQMGPS